MDAPYSFRHDLDLDLFALDRIDALFRRAPAGMAAVQMADASREREIGATPTMTELRGAISNEALTRPLHVHLHYVSDWAPEYTESRQRVLEAAGIPATEPRYGEITAIRVFSPGVPVSLHADGETQLNCGVAGHNDWHVYTPSGLSQSENEALMRGGQFFRWREMTLFATFALGPGDAFAAPPRWPHWIEHPGPDPAVSFEVGFWTADDVRARKVWDVNWLMRKARLSPRPPGENPRVDRRKGRVFDAISVATRKGAEYRGL